MAYAVAIGFAGYDLPEVLHEEGDVVLRRGVRQSDGRLVLAWLSPADGPGRSLVERLQRELAVLAHLAAEAELPGELSAVARGIGLERDGAALALVLCLLVWRL